MKTLVFFGSAREKGHTRAMVDLLLENLEGEKEIIDAYRTEVQPCKDCRFCWHKKGCSIKDGMQDIYQKIEEADNIILASPMYFHSITGELKSLIDRLQLYWAGHIRNDMPTHFIKKGAILMVGGAPSFENQFLGGELVFKNLLNDLSAELVGEVCLPNSDVDSLETRQDIAKDVVELANKLNQANSSK
ncbi:flavodoxin family protein [Paludicola sp. MB14-C6]|uniref:flavodoxin family protein n=1 Tax=Paludihabitans sp. MB14-C6 TaxID=3070656 RepID=UPI0027DB5934|nr:flavodoxin family protein [Paludicola sp. MB14-C6]WMJ23544.1 flavodoxin family protein [Paludicola sp. MB14-C6]